MIQKVAVEFLNITCQGFW